MYAHRTRFFSLLLIVALGSGMAARAAPQTPTAAPPIPSATAFDALFKRLDTGDLSERDTPRQIQIVAQLQQLLPPGDAHRQRLLDTQRCGLDFTNAAKDGYTFADAHLAAALLAHDDDTAIRFYYCRGGYQESLTTPRDALTDYNHGIDLARARNDEPMLATGLQMRGGIYSLLGIYGKALADLLEAQRLYLRSELPIAADMTLLDIGIAYRRLGYPDKAREYLQQSIAHEESVGDHESLFASTLQMGFANEEAGSFDAALKIEQRALNLATATGDRGSVGSAHLAIASVLTNLHRYPDALDSLQKAETNFSAAGDTADHGMVMFQRGRALAGLGQSRNALEAFGQAETAFSAGGNQRYLEMLHQAKAATLEASGQIAAALDEYKRYLAAHDQVASQRADQQAQMLREQFDTDRSKMENERLRAEQDLKNKQVEVLQRVRRWQQVAMGLLAILLGLLALLVIRQLARLRRWKRIASIDVLTGVANRRGIEYFAENAIRHARLRQRHEPLATLVIDVDEFKRINDRFGHATGDRVLQRIAHACAETLRENDLLGRTGGEEFLVILPGSDIARATEVAERLRNRVAGLNLDDLAPGLLTTISIGVAEMSAKDAGLAELERRADEALYRAKADGRNRVVSTTTAAGQDRGEPAATATGGAPASR
jgi:diguanylate cyclase (GGDEF)-like protein